MVEQIYKAKKLRIGIPDVPTSSGLYVRISIA